MSEPISESLRTIHRRGVDAFGGTALASDVGPTVRRVARRRVGRAVGAVAAAVAFVAAASVGSMALASARHDAAQPGASASATPSASLSYTVIVPPGSSATDVKTLLNIWLGIPEAETQALFDEPTRLARAPEAGMNVEGWLSPRTYHFPVGTTAKEAIDAMIANTVAFLDERGVAKADRLRVLTLASVIEHEATPAADRTKLARVLENRLSAGMTLELRSPVQTFTCFKGSGEPSPDLPGYASVSCVDYSTSVLPGLPATPIATAPSAASIDAALHPADGTWLYYTVVNLATGETRFATTDQEHAADELLLQQWMLGDNSKMDILNILVRSEEDAN
jgi:UPF0755 protein